MKKKAVYPSKTSMNLFYKPDRTTKPATAALYVLFALVCLLGLSKLLVYDLWMEKQAAEQGYEMALEELADITIQLEDYDEVEERYFRYSATNEERTIVDRMETLAMVESAVGDATLDSVAISGNRVQLQISDVTLAKTAVIVNRLEASPLVAGTVVNTASTINENVEYVGFLGLSAVEADSWDLVRANIVIELQKEAEEG